MIFFVFVVVVAIAHRSAQQRVSTTRKRNPTRRIRCNCAADDQHRTPFFWSKRAGLCGKQHGKYTGLRDGRSILLVAATIFLIWWRWHQRSHDNQCGLFSTQTHVVMKPIARCGQKNEGHQQSQDTLTLAVRRHIFMAARNIAYIVCRGNNQNQLAHIYDSLHKLRPAAPEKMQIDKVNEAVKYRSTYPTRWNAANRLQMKAKFEKM
eukprot:6171969-Pleurochrysis_carterae.AAC.4